MKGQGGVEGGRGMATEGHAKEPRNHIFKHKAERVNYVG